MNFSLSELTWPFRYIPKVGILSLLKFIHGNVWKWYVDLLPSELRGIRQKEETLKVRKLFQGRGSKELILMLVFEVLP